MKAVVQYRARSSAVWTDVFSVDILYADDQIILVRGAGTQAAFHPTTGSMLGVHWRNAPQGNFSFPSLEAEAYVMFRLRREETL